MDSGPLAVHLAVRQCINTLSTSRDITEVTEALRTAGRYLSGTEDDPPACQREEFARAHYTKLLQFLISNLNAHWLELLTPEQHMDLWVSLFLNGPPDQVLLVLLDCVNSCSMSSGLERGLDVLEYFLQRGRLSALLWATCQGPPPANSPQLRDALLSRLVALPDLLANRLQEHTRPAFQPLHYYPLLARELSVALERTCQALREEMFGVLVPCLSALTQSDFVWKRVCWQLVESVPDRWMEGVVSGLVQTVDGSAALSRLLGNVVLKNKKAQFVITNKLLLLQYKYKTPMLQSLLGYLAEDSGRRPLLIQVLKALCGTWSSCSAVKHSPIEQQLYISKALLICLGLLRDSEVLEHREELLQCMLSGMQCHLDSSIPRVHHLGKVVGESLSARLDPGGTRLQFQYELDTETKELLSLLSPPPAHQQPPETLPPDSRTEPAPKSPSSEREEGKAGVPAARPIKQHSSDSELDSDDELTPYDMTRDGELGGALAPRYIRDCLEALTSSEDPGKVEVSLGAAEGLIKKNPAATREVSVELVKVLLHLEDRFNTQGFLRLRQRAMVSLTVTDTLAVTGYLTTEFYSLNYSLRQRLDILEVLALAAQDLSQPTSANSAPSKHKPPPLIQPVSTETAPDLQGTGQHWRRVVDQRIESKTRRFGKGAPRTGSSAAPSRFAPVAGCFFFPLLRNYDRPQVTFDLLGSDHLVLGRLVHTLGVLMYFAVNAPVATQMGKALLDFVWAIRYHTDPVVRQGVLFAVSAVLLSVPNERMFSELSDEMLEARAWLGDVAEADPDADCRGLAGQSLLLLEKILKKSIGSPSRGPNDQALQL
ncbi:Telomere length regulation protein TEL2-like [Acipenser ruthenus]|uniref:Telomere length regulation protein TEL2 homolog n=1 Tax=Acipenser ruthenus TaxID=7906 RepID=A0A444TXI6_ACIRT|nr:Telomere length regulation protein TEL2-like [Acipenser ruthenus]